MEMYAYEVSHKHVTLLRIIYGAWRLNRHFYNPHAILPYEPYSHCHVWRYNEWL
jgi:hypothetical protein